MQTWFRNASFLLLVSLTLGVFGFLSRDLYRLLSLLSFVIFLSSFGGEALSLRGVRPRDVAGACLIIAAGLVLSRFAPLGTFHFYFFALPAFAVLIRKHETPALNDFYSYIISFAAVGMLAELERVFPVLWHFKVDLASGLSHAATVLAREDRNLGATAMGLPILASLFVLSTIRESMAARRSALRWLSHLVILSLAHLFYLVALTWYARLIAGFPPPFEWLLLNSQHCALALGSAAFTLLDRRRSMSAYAPRLSRRHAPAVAAAFLLGFAVSAALGWAPPPPQRTARVMIYDAGYLNWVVPVHGKYGEHSAGMFGVLPPALEAVGFDVTVSNDLGRLKGENPPDVIVMINIQEYFDEKDTQTIWDFVEKGGGLLCLGDHTGVAGIRGPFNELLKPVGIRFLFDSATFFGDGWNEALELRNHPLNGGAATAEDYQIWVGASLELDHTARPVIVARYGYSDWGNPADIQRSFLGDRTYNPGELLGDLVLAADARFGKGTVMVFGDTSGYQNFSLGQSLDTVARSLHYCSHGSRRGPGARMQIFLIVLVLAAAVILAAASPFMPVFIMLGAAAASGAVRLAAPPYPHLIPRFAAERPEAAAAAVSYTQRSTAIIDVSHGGRFTMDAWESNSIGGFQLNLYRSGFYPMIQRAFSRANLEAAKLLVIIAPTRSYSRGEIECIERFIANGGHALVTAGFEEYDGSAGLIEHFGMSVANVPLGRISIAWRSDTLAVDIQEGWPVRAAPGVSAETLLATWNMPVALRRAIGRGTLTVIGDSSFLYDSNLETLDTYFPGNVAFLESVIEPGRTR